MLPGCRRNAGLIGPNHQCRKNRSRLCKITNTVNGKCYIGVTTETNPNRRWMKHKSAIRANIGCPFLQKAVKKYGEESFKFEVLIICFDEDAFKFEPDYIKKLMNFTHF